MSNEEILKKAFDKYEAFLKKSFNDKFEDFKVALDKSQALISGGSVLHFLFDDNKEYNGDIDIYVNIKNSREIRNFIASLPKCYILKNSNQNRYNQHFLKINNIKKILQFKVGTLNLDLMYIQNKRSVESVVTNFDFTCCQNYYDGKEIKSTHLDLTLEKKYLVNEDFKMFYQEKSVFSEKRLKKYEIKGFSEKKTPASAGCAPVINKDTFNVNGDIKDANEINVYNYIFGWTCNYRNFVPCRTKKYFAKYFFNKYTSIKSEDPELIQNNQFVFYSDDVDQEDFSSLEDYKKINMFDNVKENIRLAVYQIDTSLNSIVSKRVYESNFVIKKLEGIRDALKKEFGEAFFRDILDMEIPKPIIDSSKISITLPLQNNKLNVGEFLAQSRDNIVFVFNKKYYGFERDYIYRTCINKAFKIKNINNLIIYQVHPKFFIFKDDVNKIHNNYFRIFETTDSGFKFETSLSTECKVYNLSGLSVKMFTKNYF